MIEKQITDEFDKYLRQKNIFFIGKNDARNHARSVDDGRPDRICFLPKGIVIIIEFKTPEKIKTKNNGLRPKQIEWKDYLLKNKFNYYLLDSAKIAKKILDKHLKK